MSFFFLLTNGPVAGRRARVGRRVGPSRSGQTLRQHPGPVPSSLLPYRRPVPAACQPATRAPRPCFSASQYFANSCPILGRVTSASQPAPNRPFANVGQVIKATSSLPVGQTSFQVVVRPSSQASTRHQPALALWLVVCPLYFCFWPRGPAQARRLPLLARLAFAQASGSHHCFQPSACPASADALLPASFSSFRPLLPKQYQQAAFGSSSSAFLVPSLIIVLARRPDLTCPSSFLDRLGPGPQAPHLACLAPSSSSSDGRAILTSSGQAWLACLALTSSSGLPPVVWVVFWLVLCLST